MAPAPFVLRKLASRAVGVQKESFEIGCAELRRRHSLNCSAANEPDIVFQSDTDELTTKRLGNMRHGGRCLEPKHRERAAKGGVQRIRKMR